MASTTGGDGPGGGIVARYRSISVKWPLSVAFVTCLAKGSASDAVAQVYLEGAKPRDIDWGRNARFSLFSAAYLGCGQHFIYNILYTRIFSKARDAVTVFKKVCVDNLIHVPIFYLPLYYASKALMLGGHAMAGLAQYRDEARECLINYWKIWTPVQIVNFWLMPTELRVAFMACASFFWLIVLSFISHKKERGEGGGGATAGDDAAPPVDGDGDQRAPTHTASRRMAAGATTASPSARFTGAAAEDEGGRWQRLTALSAAFLQVSGFHPEGLGHPSS